MKAKLLLLLCCLFAIEGWANSNDIRLVRIDVRPNPMGIPISPPTESCSILSNMLDISFDRIEAYATVTVTNKITGEIVHLKTYNNVNVVMIDLSDYDEGEYSIHITLNDYSVEGIFTMK